MARVKARFNSFGQCDGEVVTVPEGGQEILSNLMLGQNSQDSFRCYKEPCGGQQLIDLTKILEIISSSTQRKLSVGECPNCGEYYAIHFKPYTFGKRNRIVNEDDVMPWDPAVAAIHNRHRASEYTGYRTGIDDDFKD